jgi:acetone carboxylase gamma subunit
MAATDDQAPSVKLTTDYICPTCGALPGERCHRLGYPILGYHDERHQAAGHGSPSA